MKKAWLLTFFLLIIIGLPLIILNCAGVSDDDKDENAASEGTRLSGAISYDGIATGEDVVIGAFDQWDSEGPGGAPVWYTASAVPESGFPFEFDVPCEVSGTYFLAAYLDVDPNDSVAMNIELDPMAIPTEATDIVDGEDNPIDFHLKDDAWDTDDDDASDDDDSSDDDDATDDDDDTTNKTGITGTITYAGSKTGDTIVFGFWTGQAMGPPVHHTSYDIIGSSFPIDYTVETEFTGDWRIVAYLDVDPYDGDSINFDKDPNNWKLVLPATTIVEGSLTTFDIELVDP